MLNLPTQPRHISGPLAVILLAVAAIFFEPSSSYWLAYDRTLVKSYEVWRLISGNFVHTNANHLLLNIAGLALLWALHGDYYKPRQYLLLFLLCCLGCTLGIYYFSPQLVWYAGLSGALHGLFVWGAYEDIRHKLPSGWLLLTGVWVKVIYEQWQGPSEGVGSLIEAQVAIDAHLYGAVTGMVIVALLAMWHWRQKSAYF